MLLLLACVTDAIDDTAASTTEDEEEVHSGHTLDIPGHNECLEEGEQMTEAICVTLVEEDGRYPGVSEDKTPEDTPDDVWRLDDEEYLWLESEIRRCACACCHQSSIGGPGAYFWDLDWEPVWIDSASLWTLSVFGGWTEEPDQTLPTEDVDRLRALLEAEADRRYPD